MQLMRIRIHPVKSLSGVDVTSAAFTAAGSLVDDRRWCLVRENASDITPDSVYMTKVDKTDTVSLLPRTHVREYDPDAKTIVLELDGDCSPQFRLPHDRLPHDGADLAAWCSAHFGTTLRVEESADRGFPDVAVFMNHEEAAARSGPTLISTSTLAYLGDQLGLSAEELLLRFRSNLVIHSEELPPFGEDQLSELALGEAKLAIAGRVKRCPVPARDVQTGGYDRHFAKRLIDAKAATHAGQSLDRSELYTASVFTRVLTPGATIRVER